MEFPQESIDQARDIVKKYRDRDSSKKGLAKQLYRGDFIELQYGFSESIKSGNCGRFFHEVKKEVECYTMAGVLYLIAREADLEPKIYSAIDMKDIKEGAESDKGTADHAFISVKLNKNEEYLIDPQYTAWGKITSRPEKNQIEIYDNVGGTMIFRDYALLTNLTEKEYLKKLMENRSPRGGRITLASTQVLRGIDGIRVFTTYLPETKELKTAIDFGHVLFGPEPYKKAFVKELKTFVNEDGSFDLEKGTFSLYNVKGTGWTEHNTPQVPFVFKMEDAKFLWSFWEDILKESGRRSPPHTMLHSKLFDKILRLGVRTDFGIAQDSFAEKIAKQKNLENILQETQKWSHRIVNDFVKETKQDEISYRVLLADSQATKIRDQSRSDKNPHGLVYTKQEHIDLLEKELQSYMGSVKLYFDSLEKQLRVACGLKKGKTYKARREHNKRYEGVMKETVYFDEMKAANSLDFPFTFNLYADSYIIGKKFDAENLSISELEKGLTKKDVFRGAQEQFFLHFFSAFFKKEHLLLKQYKKGLQKILNRKV